jgi:hypothetical protein
VLHKDVDALSQQATTIRSSLEASSCEQREFFLRIDDIEQSASRQTA